MKTVSEMISVMQAAEDGAELEALDLDDKQKGWYAISAASWNWNGCDYRIKPEPRVFYAGLRQDGTGTISDHKEDDYAGAYEVIKLIEVIE